jgi:RNA polymerase sigma-70 factor (ECF subfamily)
LHFLEETRVSATGEARPVSHGVEDPSGVTGDTDENAVERVLAGEVEAFEEIVGRWQRPLVNLAWRYCRDRAQAEELAQEVFLRIYRTLATWRRESSFSTWMFAVATNVIRNRMRQRLPPQVHLDDAPAWALSDDPVGEAERRDVGERVRQAVRFLPPRYRDAVVVYYFQEQDTASAAESLGVSPGTLKARLHRARALLIRRLEHLALGDRIGDGGGNG